MRDFPEIGSQWRHAKSDAFYKVIGLCLIEATLTPGVVYEGGGFYDDGRLWTTWVRPASEFMDGRFIRVVAAIPIPTDEAGREQT